MEIILKETDLTEYIDQKLEAIKTVYPSLIEAGGMTKEAANREFKILSQIRLICKLETEFFNFTYKALCNRLGKELATEKVNFYRKLELECILVQDFDKTQKK